MRDAKYDKQRTEGATQIKDKLEQFATDAGLGISAEWFGGVPKAHKDQHVLEVVAGNKVRELKFSDEEVMDYSGGAGTSKTNEKLHELIALLKQQQPT